MYIEQGYKGNLGLWKYAIIPMGFLALMVFNYISTIMSPIPVDELMNDLIQDFGSNTVFVMLIAPLSFSLFLVLGWTKLVHSQSITSLTTSRKSIDWQRVFFSFALWGSITAAMTFTYVAIAPENYVLNFQLKPFLILAFLSILLIPLQSSFEEYLFRGHLMQGLGILAKNRWVPLIVTSVLFGLMHLGNPEVGKLGYGIMIYYIGTGFFLGILTLMDEGLELALGFMPPTT